MKQNQSFVQRRLLLWLLAVLFAVGANAQTKITGKVIASDDRQPVVGASIKIKNGAGGTSTDANGVFTLSAKSTDVLVVSFVGYAPQEVTVGNQTNLNITLAIENNNLSDVVVTGYSSQRKKDLTGAVAVVDMGLLKAQPAASAVEALQGKATGVSIINDGAPGSTPQIRIRGTSTINNNEPLYVIDGVPFEGKLSWLNQNDIESLQVLKDASSASIYGSRANNGVVIITTKKGTSGAPKITVDSYYGTQAPRKGSFPEMMTPQQYAQYVFDSYTNSGKAIAAGRNYGSGPTPTLPEYLVAGSVLGQDVTAADADPSKYNYSRDPSLFYQITRANKAGTNWFDEITKAAPIQNYQLGATGGSENATYALSAGYLNQKGTIEYTGFTRYNFRSNATVNAFNKRVRFGENAQYSYSEGFGFGVNPNTPGGYQDQGSALGWAYRIPTIIPVYDINGNFAGSRGSQLGNAENPLAFLYRAKDNVNKNNFFFGNIFAEGDIVKGLVLKTNFGIRYENYNGLSMRYPNLEFSEGNNSNNLNEYQGYNTEWTWTNTLNYTATFAEKHRLTALVGTEAIRSRSRQLNAGRNDFFLLGDLNYYYLNTGSSNISNSSTGSIGSLFSLFTKIDYSFNDRYLASFTLRRDGSSNFGPANKYGFYPAASVAWRISEESFLKDAKWVSDLKLRVGYGQTGNQRIPPYQYINRYQSSIINAAYAVGGGNTLTTGVWQNAYQNADVKWESLKALNVGIDFTIFDGKFDGSIDAYSKKTTDMLYNLPLPVSVVGGGSAPFVNIGDMSNKGVEFNVAYHHGRKADDPFKFDVGLNFSKNVNKIDRLAPGIFNQVYGNYRSLQTSVLQQDAAFGSFYGYKTNGIYQSTAEIQSGPSYAGARVGGLKYMDINGDGIIDPKDRTIIGDPNPDFTYGVNLNASYKNFDISAFLYGVQGNDIFEATRYFTDFPSFDGAKSTRLLNAWSPTNRSSNIPSAYAGASDVEFASSSYYIQSGSFLRLKNIQVGYSIPVKVFGTKSGVSRFRIYASASNLFTITKYTGLDPEVTQITDTFTAPGVDQGVYPSPRQFLLGINVGF
ncbi:MULTISPECIES: TonB-dependent receptor [unclassified Pedobacter]|uniref:SusC/RagA family TonB-linked outer membrane protein n=1 Tax=unclassified Pedobacter TaxID=2628915 RepID=UPI001E6091D6|nr:MULTISPECIES: TonB-dependent receptor [unclassified Pedobacter]